MDDLSREEVHLSASECARRMGLSVRALRLYEKYGLVCPRRTGKQWRLYGAEDIARLNEVLALKALGFSLASIANLLQGKATDLGRTLAIQRDALLQVSDRAGRGLAMIEFLQAKVAGGASLTITDLTELAKESSMVENTEAAIAWRRYEQNRPRTEVAIDTSIYSDFAGSYRIKDGPFYFVSTRDGRLFTRVVGQSDIEIFPESETQFFMKVLPVQVTFVRDEQGSVSSLVHHQNGVESPAERVAPELAERAEEDLHHRIREKIPLPHSEKIIRRIIAQHLRGEPDFDSMAPALAELARQQQDVIQADLARAGDLKDISFKGVSQAGWDVYEVRFANSNMEWSFISGEDGKISGLYLRDTP